jgi:hypothetical protein
MAKQPSRKKASGPPKTMALRHIRSPSFQTVVSDGALVRAHPESTVITFFYNDSVVTSQKGTLMQADTNVASYKLTDLVEESCRVQNVAVRIANQEALALASLIVEQLSKVRPELLDEHGIQVSPEKIKRRQKTSKRKIARK